MKSFAQIDELAAEYAKEIVVATVNIESTYVDEKGGKDVAEFYTAIFNGISKALKESSIKDYDNP